MSHVADHIWKIRGSVRNRMKTYRASSCIPVWWLHARKEWAGTASKCGI